ncbi:Sister chromatid cohesion protein 2 [Malassezia brasiliensis]|uniref:Sister chromatid cohesion protein n=1 Tax=Malassezia brasiliensis TaxID=1821822 RepID=A0AAF0DT05_9BASI|nr:Sister chromatid cohesion protein 2 [Malassezia brasiliensis]
MAERGAEAYPITPPPAAEVGTARLDSSPEAEFDTSWTDDVPARLRARAAPSTVLGKRAPDDAPTSDAPTSDVPTSDAPTSDASKYLRLASGERSDVILPTSDAFDGQMDDAWDLDDAQLYSGEALLLAPDASPSHAEAHAMPRTPAVALQHTLEALVREDDGHAEPRLLHRVEDERVLRPAALHQLHSTLRRCARDAKMYAVHAPDVPHTLLDLDATHLARLLDVLERTMRAMLRVFSPDDTLGESVMASLTGLVAAQCVLVVLAHERLPKHLFAEELVELCVATLKAPLERLVVPLVEARASGTGPLADLATQLDADPRPDALRDIDVHFHLVCATFAQLDEVLAMPTVGVSDALLIACVYVALAPFYAQDTEARTAPDEAPTSAYTRGAVLRPLRLTGLGVLRHLFTHYPAQRVWVLSEVLVSLLRLPDLRAHRREFRLANGKKIYALTALLLQLVQAAAAEPPARREQVHAWIDEGRTDTPAPGTNQSEVHALAHSVARYLAQKAAQAKLVKNSQELSYASVVYALLDDLLTLLFLPDWPAAPLLLASFCRTFVAFVHDAKSSVDAKAIALDHLGVVAARLQRAHAELGARRRLRPLRAVAEAVADADIDALHDREQAVYGVAHRLRMHAMPDAEAAAVFHLAQLGQEVVTALDAQRDVPADDPVRMALAAIYARIRVSEPGTPVEAPVVPQLVLSSAYMVHTPQLIAPILRGANATALATRTRALRALGNVAAVDTHLLDDAAVREVVRAHVVDTSASVRETAIAILGAYMLQSRAARAEYRAEVTARAMDAAVGVRRRVLRVLRSLCASEEAYADQLEVVVRIVRAVHDEDVGIQTLAVRTLAALWLPAPADASEEEAALAVPVDVGAQLLADVGAWVRERPSPLDAFLRRIDTADAGVRARLGALVDALLAHLFAETPTDAQIVLDRLRVVQLLVTAYPAVLTLLPYVSGAESPEDVAVMEEVLRIYVHTVPHLPRTARAFAESLEQSLTPLVSRCTLRPDTPALEALVACFCAVIEHQTHHSALLQRTFDACAARLTALAADATPETPLDRAAFLTMAMSALLCRYGARLDAEIHAAFDALLTLHTRPAFAHAALAALGHVLCARPALFLDVRITHALDAALGDTPAAQHVVLCVLLDYLESDAGTDAAVPRAVDAPADVLSELRGTTDEHADTGIASALVQRYAPAVLRATLDVQHAALQRTALEIVQVSVLQGLAHPLQCLPYLVALETSEEAPLRRRALGLHWHLVTKHATLLATHYIEPMRVAFAFGVAQHTERPRGFREDDEPVALFQGWYGMVREQRSARHAFLRALVRLCEVPHIADCTDADVALAAFALENLATLEYKVLDEPLWVLHELHRLHAVFGMQVVGAAERHLRQRGPSPLTDEEDAGDDSGPTADDATRGLALAAVVVQAVQALRSHLQKLYKLSNAKFEKYLADGRPERLAPAHRTLADPRQVVPALALTRVHSDSQAVAVLEDLVDAAHDGALDLD